MRDWGGRRLRKPSRRSRTLSDIPTDVVATGGVAETPK
jgi:hypothetical protein